MSASVSGNLKVSENAGFDTPDSLSEMQIGGLHKNFRQEFDPIGFNRCENSGPR